MPRSHRSGADGVVRPAQRLAELTTNRGFALTGSRFAPGAPASIKLSRHPYVTVITKSSTNLGAAFCAAATRGIEFRPLCMRRHVSDLSAAGAEPRSFSVPHGPVDKDVTLFVPDEDVADPELSIVIPALNEELTVGRFVDWCREGLREANVRGEIIIVDSSSDRTAEIALSRGARVLKTPKRGLGRAYIDALP